MTIADTPLVIGTSPAATLAGRLGSALWRLPDVGFDAGWSGGRDLEEWRATTMAGPPSTGVVVAVWTVAPARAQLVHRHLDDWIATFEAPFGRWFVALGAGAARCADGGQLVAVVDRPRPVDGSGWAPESSVADAVEVMARSFALVHGSRGVRINVVATPGRLVGGDPAAPAGRAHGGPSEVVDEVVDEVAGAVRMLLAGEAFGVSGNVVHVGGGRP